MTTQFEQAVMLNLRCELEVLITRREGMVAENQKCLAKGEAPKYTMGDFEEIANSISYIVPNPHNYE